MCSILRSFNVGRMVDLNRMNKTDHRCLSACNFAKAIGSRRCYTREHSFLCRDSYKKFPIYSCTLEILSSSGQDQLRMFLGLLDSDP
jgi:hypothetical protein